MIVSHVLIIDPSGYNACRVELEGGVKITFKDLGLAGIRKSAIQGVQWVSNADFRDALMVATREIHSLKMKLRRRAAPRIPPVRSLAGVQLHLF